MIERTFTRRTALAAGAGALIGAATARWPKPALAVSASAPAPADASPQLLPPSADVWALSLPVQGTPAAARLTAAGHAVATSRSEGRFQAQVDVGPGATTVVARDPRGGASASQTYVGRVPDRPTARATASVQAGGVRLSSSGSTADPYSGAPIASTVWATREGAALGSGSELTLAGPWADGEQYVVATVTDANGRTDDTTIVFVVAAGRPAAVELGAWQPQWVRDAVVYGAIPPLFGQPPLQALTQSLDRLAALGVSVLWLAPVFACEEGDYGYAVTDYFSVRADYGSLADLQALVAQAHARGIRVILDLPLNDTSVRHPYFRQARSVGVSSHYWDFYERNENGRAQHYFDWSNLKNLEYANAEVRALATEVGAYWLRVAEVDGYRCDAAWGVQERTPGFWAQWRAELQRIRPDVLLLAESTARQAWPAQAGFSAAYDWTEELGEWAWDRAFSNRRQVTSRLYAALSVPELSRPFRFLEDNDTGARFISRHGAPMTRAAAAMLLSLPGLPCIFSGQEIGAEFLPYRRQTPLDWSHDPDGLEDVYRNLIAQRAAEPGLGEGTLQLLSAAPAERVLAYSVTGTDSAVLVAVNFSANAVVSEVVAGPEPQWTQTLELPAWSAVRKRLT